MIILGIDPGYDRLGVAVIERPERGKEILRYSNCFITDRADLMADRLLSIGNEVSRVLDLFKPDIMGIETLFITKNQKTAMRVAETRGIIMYEATKRKTPVCELSPMEIKMAITSDGSSDKERMIRMVKILLSLPDKKTHDDEYDAIAVALTTSAQSPTLIHRKSLLPK